MRSRSNRPRISEVMSRVQWLSPIPGRNTCRSVAWLGNRFKGSILRIFR
jgi:hypothetical protein